MAHLTIHPTPAFIDLKSHLGQTNGINIASNTLPLNMDVFEHFDHPLTQLHTKESQDEYRHHEADRRVTSSR